MVCFFLYMELNCDSTFVSVQYTRIVREKQTIEKNLIFFRVIFVYIRVV